MMIGTAGLRWHVQESGSGPVMLLVHGTGAAIHSWRDLAPLLADRFRVIAADLPGHGRSSSPGFAGFSLPGIAGLLHQLLRALDARPLIMVGHSAGAAIAVRMTLDGLARPRVLVGINAALLPLTGFPRRLFAPVAKLLARSTVAPKIFARRAAGSAAVERLIHETGSHLDPAGIELYRQVVGRPEHIAAALSMMANWDLRTLAADLPRLRVPLKLLTGDRDWTVSPAEALRVRALLPSTEVKSLGNVGHLAHEERPNETAELLGKIAVEAGIL